MGGHGAGGHSAGVHSAVVTVRVFLGVELRRTCQVLSKYSLVKSSWLLTASRVPDTGQPCE